MLSEMSDEKEKKYFFHMRDIKPTKTTNKLSYRQQNGGSQREGPEDKDCKGVKSTMTEGD